MTLPELREEKGRLAAQAQAILTKVADEKRVDLTKEEDAAFEKIHADIDKLSKQILRLEKQDATMASLQESQGRKSDPNPSGQRSTQGLARITDHDRGEALRAWMTAGAPESEITPEQRELASRCGVDLNSKRINIRLGTPMGASFWTPDGLRSSVEDVRAWKERQAEQRAALTAAQATTTTGGYTTADETMQALEVALLAYSNIRGVATVRRTATGGPLPFPTTNDTANKGEIIGENTTSTELEMTFGQLVLDAYKYSSKYILASIEFLQDTSINANQFIGEALGIRIARITNDHFTTGDGSGKPNGIVNASTAGVTGVADPPTYENFLDLVHAIDPAYRGNARFMFNDATLKSIRKIKALQYSGDAVGIPLWQPGLVAGQPDTILGYPYVINQSMAAPGATSKKILFGDFSKYQIRDVRDVTLLRLDELFALLGQVAFLALSRHDGDLLNAGTNPVKHMAQT